MVLRIDFVPTSHVASLAVAMSIDANKAGEPSDVLVSESYYLPDGMLCWDNTVITHGFTVRVEELPFTWPDNDDESEFGLRL